MHMQYFPAFSIVLDRFYWDLPVFIQKKQKYALRIELFKKNRGNVQSELIPPPMLFASEFIEFLK